MAEQAIVVQEPMHAPEASDSAPNNVPHNALEQRVQRLEDAVAALQDTHLIEERLIERAQNLLQERATGASAAATRPAPAQQIYDASRFPPPRPSAASAPAPPLLELPPPSPPPNLNRSWLLFDLAAEMRAMVSMFFDRNYHTAWTTRIAVLVLIPMILLSHWWFAFAWVPLVGPILDKILNLALAFFLYKALSREAHRYLETAGRHR
jgi:hypothetical protein